MGRGARKTEKHLGFICCSYNKVDTYKTQPFIAFSNFKLLTCQLHAVYILGSIAEPLEYLFHS